MTDVYLTGAGVVYLVALLAAVAWGAAELYHRPGLGALYREKRHGSLLVGMLGLVGLALIFAGVGAATGGLPRGQELISTLVFMGLLALGSAALYPAAIDAEQALPRRNPAHERSRFLWLAAGMMVWSWSSFTVILWIAGQFTPAPPEMRIVEDGVSDMLTPSLPLQFLAFSCIALLAAVVEEVIFRGGVQGWLEARGLPPAGAIGIASAIFALGHAGTYVEPHGLKEAQIFGLSLFFGYAKWRWGLGSAIVLHLLNNGVALMATPFVPEAP